MKRRRGTGTALRFWGADLSSVLFMTRFKPLAWVLAVITLSVSVLAQTFSITQLGLPNSSEDVVGWVVAMCRMWMRAGDRMPDAISRCLRSLQPPQEGEE